MSVYGGGGVDALGRVDGRVPVLVDPAAAGGEVDRCAGARLTVSVPSAPPPWPTTLIAIVAIPRRASDDGDDERARVLVVGEAVPEDRDRPAARGRGSGGRKRLK